MGYGKHNSGKSSGRVKSDSEKQPQKLSTLGGTIKATGDKTKNRKGNVSGPEYS